MLTVLGGLAEFERDLILQRTGEGRKRATAAGVKFGRRSKLSLHQRREVMKRLEAGESQASIARSYDVDRAVICKWQTGRPRRENPDRITAHDERDIGSEFATHDVPKTQPAPVAVQPMTAPPAPARKIGLPPPKFSGPLAPQDEDQLFGIGSWT